MAPSSLRDFRLQIQHATTDRDEQVRKVTVAIDTISGSRIRRAELTSSQGKLDELNEGLTQLRRDNDRSEFFFFGDSTFALTPPSISSLQPNSASVLYAKALRRDVGHFLRQNFFPLRLLIF